MLADYLGRAVALDALGAGVPFRDDPRGVHHEDGVIGYSLDEEAEAALALTQVCVSRAQLPGAIVDPLLERLVELAQRALGVVAVGQIDQHVNRTDEPA